MRQLLLVADGTPLVMKAWFAGADAPWAVAREAVRRDMRGLSHGVVVLDRTMDTFRRELDPRYKAHRPPAPPDLIEHFDRFTAELERIGVLVLGSLTYEADDLMATLARTASEQGLATHLWAADKDLFQLVREEPPVVVVAPGRGWHIDRAGVFERLGVWPEQMVDYQALVGDSSDGVVGVKGVGAKTAAALLQHMGSLDALYQRLDEVKTLPIRGARTLAAKLEAGRQDALLARQLVRLVDTVDLGPDLLERCRR